MAIKYTDTWHYRVEPFPGPRGSGRHTEFLYINQIRVLHTGNRWIKLEPQYVFYFWRGDMHRGDLPTNQAIALRSDNPHAPHREYTMGDEFAQKAMGIYSEKGMAVMERDPEDPANRDERERLDAESQSPESQVARKNRYRLRAPAASQITWLSRILPSCFKHGSQARRQRQFSSCGSSLAMANS